MRRRSGVLADDMPSPDPHPVFTTSTTAARGRCRARCRGQGLTEAVGGGEVVDGGGTVVSDDGAKAPMADDDSGVALQVIVVKGSGPCRS
jgi:hypothetical protein